MSNGLATRGYVEEGGTAVLFIMRAFNTDTMAYVFWTSTNVPDPTGASSPYDPGDLTDIVIALRQEG